MVSLVVFFGEPITLYGSTLLDSSPAGKIFQQVFHRDIQR